MSASRSSKDKPLTPRHAWQPFTPRGVAAFAFASGTRLFLAQLIVAALGVAAVLFFLRAAWLPVFTQAIQQLPERGEIRGAALHTEAASARLAENPRLSLVLDLDGAARPGRVSDVEVVFKRDRLIVCGALGCWEQAYQPGFVIAFNKAELAPWWEAWRLPVLIAVAVATALWLFLSWWMLALFYTPVTKLVAFYVDREVTWRGAWRMSGAALLPGAVLCSTAIVLYGFGAVDLLRFALLCALHFVAQWAFIGTSPFFLPKVGEKPKGNPFAGAKAEEEGAAANPFTGKASK